jgi:hypothetical protein
MRAGLYPDFRRESSNMHSIDAAAVAGFEDNRSM